jgi:predicted metal-dependent phosphoesterase TrpH
VPHRWATLKNAVTWIGDAGGIAIVAHPARYKFSPTEEYALFTEFKGHGGRGVEVVTGSHTAAEAERYAGRRRSSTCSPRAAAISTAPTKAGSISAACRRCRRR